MQRIFAIIISGLVVLIVSLLFAQLLGGFYIYNLVVGDNLPISENTEVKAPIPPPSKKKVLRLEPIEFYTIQVGIFPDTTNAQDSLKKLTGLGLRPFVTSQAPYKIWVGCFSDVNSGKDLENALKKHGFEAFIGKGIINDRALKFPGDDDFILDYMAPLLGTFDMILNHSLKMFQSPKISTYKPVVWDNMIDKLQNEVADGLGSLDEVLKISGSGIYENELKKLKDKAQAYQGSLGRIIDTRSDDEVVYCQGHLLELIAAYHNLINLANEKLNNV
ncbi:MAG: SPOR domain-containing protein [Peptococcales bacterium]|jgi:hypothetical protein